MTPKQPAGDDARLLSEELALLIDGATNYAIYMLDPRGNVTIWNRGAERIKGWTQPEVLGQHAALFYIPEDVLAGKPHADLARASAEGRLEEDSWRLRKDGSEFFASVTITALYDEAGALRGFGKVVRDITDQKAAETALMRREQHLHSILATVPDAMIVIDEQGRIASFSSAAERIFGYAENEVLGRNVDLLMPEPDRQRHDGYLAAYLAGGARARRSGRSVPSPACARTAPLFRLSWQSARRSVVDSASSQASCATCRSGSAPNFVCASFSRS